MATRSNALVQARLAFVEGATKEYGAGKRYAQVLTTKFGKGWEKVPTHGKVSDNMKGLQTALRNEQTALYEALKAGGHSNPSVKWAQVRKHAAGPKPKGANANSSRPLDERFKQELEALFKAFFRVDEGHTPRVTRINKVIGEVLMKEYKIDLSDLKK